MTESIKEKPSVTRGYRIARTSRNTKNRNPLKYYIGTRRISITFQTRVTNYRYNFFISIIDKIFKIFNIIAILSVIGDNFGKARNTIAEVIFVLVCVYCIC